MFSTSKSFQARGGEGPLSPQSIVLSKQQQLSLSLKKKCLLLNDIHQLLLLLGEWLQRMTAVVSPGIPSGLKLLKLPNGVDQQYGRKKTG